MKNKKKSRVLLLVCAVVSFVLMLGISVSCAYAADESAVTDSVAADGNTVGNTAATDSAATEENVFEMLYNTVCSYIGEIMCALTLAGSLILTLLYKRGLMPFMTRTVGAIGSTVAGIKTSADEYAEKNTTELNEIRSALEAAQASTDKFTDRLSAIDDSLKGISLDKNEREVFKAALECQTTLLYEILMNSSIPQYQKNAVGEKLGAIKAMISGGACEEEK